MKPEQQLVDLFTRKRLTLATAESCTGGMVAGRITDVPGSSAVLLGGIVSYSNEAKTRLLGVPQEVLMQHGAVSEEVACQMARGARERLGASVAISLTGIAGPGGGTPEKPVGLTWIGLSDAQDEHAERFMWDSDRAGNRERSVDAALNMLIAWGEGQP